MCRCGLQYAIAGVGEFTQKCPFTLKKLFKCFMLNRYVFPTLWSIGYLLSISRSISRYTTCIFKNQHFPPEHAKGITTWGPTYNNILPGESKSFQIQNTLIFFHTDLFCLLIFALFVTETRLLAHFLVVLRH